MAPKSQKIFSIGVAESWTKLKWTTSGLIERPTWTDFSRVHGETYQKYTDGRFRVNGRTFQSSVDKSEFRCDSTGTFFLIIKKT